MRREIGHKLGGDARGVIVIAAGDAHERGVVAVVGHRVDGWLHGVEQATNDRVGEFVMGKVRRWRIGERGGGAARRHVGSLVPMQDVCGG